MPSQHAGPSSSNFMGISGDGVLQLTCTTSSSAAVSDQFDQVAIHLSIPSTGQDISIPMEKNSAALRTWQGLYN